MERPKAERYSVGEAESMPDDRIVEWAQGLVKHDVHAFERARRRFLRRPSASRLHELRTTARRLRSLHDDLHEAAPAFSIKRLRQLVDLTGEARDAAVLRDALRDVLDPREHRIARSMLRTLRQRERVALGRITRMLEHMKPLEA